MTTNPSSSFETELHLKQCKFHCLLFGAQHLRERFIQSIHECNDIESKATVITSVSSELEVRQRAAPKKPKFYMMKDESSSSDSESGNSDYGMVASTEHSSSVTHNLQYVIYSSNRTEGYGKETVQMSIGTLHD